MEGIAKAALRKQGLKATPGRVAVFKFLKSRKRPSSQQEMIKGLKRPVDKSTVYRIVQDFLRAGVLRQVPSAQAGQNLYELTSLPHHHHFVCTSCGRIEDIAECNVEAVANKALKRAKHFSSVQGHSLDFFGTCKECGSSSPRTR